MEQPSIMAEYAERKAREKRAADRERWRQYACAALVATASDGFVHELLAAQAADAMLKLEAERFDGGEL